MINPETGPMSRRAFLRMAAAVPPALVLAACGLDGDGNGESQSATAAPANPTDPPAVAAAPTDAPATATSPPEPVATTAPVLEATPACGDDDDEPTIAQTEGPFYTPNTPERISLREGGITGTPLLVSGLVLATDCRPVAGALLDFWHCDDAGNYDNAGFRLRGHQFADADGCFSLETIRPGLYPGRTRHIHVKVQAPNQPVLTTQLYFPDEPDNARDAIFHPALVMEVAENAAGLDARFNFVLEST
jgi:protocatechuate 3,4-dioxygenase beta subunit